MTHNLGARADGPLTLSGLRAGAYLGGYRLLRRLGAGGMGVVWEAVDGEGRHVAMKILHPQIAADPLARRRLDREARVLARVRDARVARILDIETGGESGEEPDATFVITELVDGPTLQHEVEHEGVYDLDRDVRDLADLAHGLVDALRAVHSAGVIHRDLKPSNVMLGEQGPVLIDFGIAQVADDSRLTQTGQVTGTPGFIPPEMLDGGEPTQDVDWYACAGVILFALTGHAPFGSGAWQGVFRRVYAGTPELGDLEERCPALAQALTAALAPGVEDRLSPDDLLAVLDEVAEGGSGHDALTTALGPVADQAGGDAPAPRAPAASGLTTTGTAASDPYGVLPAPHAAGAAPPAGGPGPRPVAPYGYGTGTTPQPPVLPPTLPPTAAQAPGAPASPHAVLSSTRLYPAPQTAQPPQPVPVPQPTVPGLPAPAPQQPPPQAQAPVVPALPAWAQEPRRHPGTLASVAVLLVVIGRYMAGWSIVTATTLVLVAGTVGRAQDARRWARLSRGAATPGDSSRMWLATPWYLLRSLLATFFAAALVMAATGLLAYLALRLPGPDGGSGLLYPFLDYDTRHRVVMLLWVAAYLLGLWFIPWGAPARRGGAHLVEAVAPTRSARWGVSAAVLVLALIIYGLQNSGEVPQMLLEPLWAL